MSVPKLPADPSLQLRVRERRVEAGLSQAQLAERIGLSRQAINALLQFGDTHRDLISINKA